MKTIPNPNEKNKYQLTDLVLRNKNKLMRRGFAAIGAVIIISLVAVIIYLAIQNNILRSPVVENPTPTINSEQGPILTPTPSPKGSPAPTAKPAIKLSYKLPAVWKTVTDTSGRLETGYDSSKYEATAGDNRIGLSGIWTKDEQGKPRRLGGNDQLYITNYSGGSRHHELYRILEVSNPASNIWKNLDYFSEREYSFNSWKCLAINGVNISQYPVLWVYCPISSKEAIVMSYDSYDWKVAEEKMSAVKLLK